VSSQHSQININTKAKQLRALAQGKDKQIQEKLNIEIANQRTTATRTRTAAGIREDGHKLQQIQAWLYTQVEHIVTNTLHPLRAND